MSFYPKINEATVQMLQVVVRSMETDPGYLSSDECPWSDEVRDFFLKFGTGGGGESVDLFEGETEDVAIDRQIQKLINDLEAFADTLGKGDHSEKLAYFKTKTALLEKLIGMRERVLNLREIAEFRGVLVGFMEEICSKDQLADLMERLEGILE